MKKLLTILLTILSLTSFAGTPERIGGYKVDSLAVKYIPFIKSPTLIHLSRPGLLLYHDSLYFDNGISFINLSSGSGGSGSKYYSGLGVYIDYKNNINLGDSNAQGNNVYIQPPYTLGSSFNLGGFKRWGDISVSTGTFSVYSQDSLGELYNTSLLFANGSLGISDYMKDSVSFILSSKLGSTGYNNYVYAKGNEIWFKNNLGVRKSLSQLASGSVVDSSGILKNSNSAIVPLSIRQAGKFDNGTTAPSHTTRLNYDGNLYTNALNTSSTITSTQYKLSSLNTAPSSSTDTGTTGEIRITSGYIYVCIATNTWVRSALTTF